MTSKRTKFPTSLPLALIAFGTLLFACGGGATPVKIGIVNNLRSLDPVVEAFQAEVLRSLDADVEFVSVTGNTGNLDAAVDELIAGDPDLVVSLTTPTSLMVGDKLEGTSIPQIFGMVTDPLGSHLSKASPYLATIAPGWASSTYNTPWNSP
jgi:ABC-type uncharacterized transport system substrate-binding protein